MAIPCAGQSLCRTGVPVVTSCCLTPGPETPRHILPNSRGQGASATAHDPHVAGLARSTPPGIRPGAARRRIERVADRAGAQAVTPASDRSASARREPRAWGRSRAAWARTAPARRQAPRRRRSTRTRRAGSTSRARRTCRPGLAGRSVHHRLWGSVMVQAWSDSKSRQYWRMPVCGGSSPCRRAVRATAARPAAPRPWRQSEAAEP